MIFHIAYLLKMIGELLQVSFKTPISVKKDSRIYHHYGSFLIKEFQMDRVTSCLKFIMIYQHWKSINHQYYYTSI